MWKTLGSFFKAIGHQFIGLERGLRAAQPFLTAVAKALDVNGSVGVLTIEQLCVSILGDVIDAVQDAQTGHPGAAVTLAAQTVTDVKHLIAIIRAHPEAPAGSAGR